MRVAVIGAGILGRSISLRLLNKGYKVFLFDRDGLFDRKNASYAAAGMLAPISESIKRDSQIGVIGTVSLKILKEFIIENSFKTRVMTIGTTFEAASNQENLIQEAFKSIKRMGFENAVKINSQNSFSIPDESAVDPVLLMDELAQKSLDRGLTFYQREVASTFDTTVHFATDSKSEKFDWVVDVRGIGALDSDEGLRPVRGETILLHAPSLHLTSMLRVQDIRDNFYLVPQGNGRFILGATEIEAKGNAPTVNSMVHLLGAAFRFSSELRGAEFLGFKSGVRAAYPNNLPRIHLAKGHLYVNGMFRHGFLFSPLLAKSIADFVDQGVWPSCISNLIFSNTKEFCFAESNVERQRSTNV